MRALIIGLTLLFLAGCTAMLVGADIEPAAETDQADDENKRKDKR